MQRIATRILLAYSPVVLVIGSLFSDALAATASVILVVLYVTSLLSRWWSGYLVAAFASVLVIPVLGAPHLGYWSVLLGVPALGAVAHALVGVAPSLVPPEPPVRRMLSPLATSTGMALVGVLLLAFVLAVLPLALAVGLVLVAYAAAAAVQYAAPGTAPVDC